MARGPKVTETGAAETPQEPPPATAPDDEPTAAGRTRQEPPGAPQRPPYRREALLWAVQTLAQGLPNAPGEARLSAERIVADLEAAARE